MNLVNITVAIEGALVYGLGAYEPTCTPLVTPLLVSYPSSSVIGERMDLIIIIIWPTFVTITLAIIITIVP